MHGPPGHHHDHSHDHGSQNRKRLGWAFAMSSIYMVAEFVGGWLTNSLALLADAGHMLSDVGALALSYFAIWIAARPAPSHRTYGYYRAEILAALVNGASLIAIALMIFWEAIQRFQSPEEVAGPMMMGIAIGGLIINLISMSILHGGRDESLNLRGAWLHVMMDALGSVGAILAGLTIWLFDWQWVDPLASILIGLLVIYSSWRLLAEAVSVLMESAPANIDVDEVHDAMTLVTGVIEIHDLHVWTISSGLISLSAHAVVADHQLDAETLRAMREMLHDRFGINHITIQIEPEGFEESPIPV
ncbi:MAG: cation diffusion facilitator family transporter [Planctomycetaceae bacterium]|jgi:cobalt-zinc-cadmium efflux system protein|nr:cation diffusion facilitator family transporter [Planctomycetaceae bacterium]